MAIGFSGIGSSLTEGMVRAYLLKLQQDLAQRNLAQGREEDWADFVRRQRFLEEQQRPERERLLAEQERQRVRAEALQRIQALTTTYSREQILNTPQLRAAYMKDYEIAYGGAFPTREIPEMQTVTREGFKVLPKTAPTAMELFRAGERGQSFVPKVFPTTEQVQVPTGKMVSEPILPESPAQAIVDIPGVGKVPLSQLPEGAQTALITRLFDRQNMVEVTLPGGQKVRISADKAIELATTQPTSMVTFKDPASGATVTVPATAIPSFFPRRTPGGDATETQARIKADLMKRYLAGQTLNEREQRILFGSTGEEVVSARDRQILELWRQNIDPLTGAPRDPALAARLKPDVDRIVGQLVTPVAPTGPQGQTITMAEIQQIAQARGIPIATAIQQAKAQGFQIIDEAKRPGQQAPVPSVQGMSEVVRGLKARGMVWAQARIQVIKALVDRGYSPQDAARLADSQGKQLWDRLPPKGEAPQGGVHLHKSLRALVNSKRIGQFVFRVTSVLGGKHAPGSAHYSGRAVDIVPEGHPSTWDRVIGVLIAAGYRVIDERTRKNGGVDWPALAR